jgi:hypothetical protein
MRPPELAVPFRPRLWRAIDLCGAAALAAALVHALIALARGWPHAPFVDAAASAVTLGVFVIVAILYASRWFLRPPGAEAPRSGVFGTRAPRWLSRLIRLSGRAVATAAVAGAVLLLAEPDRAAEMALRVYYLALAAFALAAWVIPRETQ